jgi:nicotinate-nucleotide adenylyltransferase
MIGIYGGTFNPIHYGHLRTALEVQTALGLQEIRFIPCYQPALKTMPFIAAEQRLDMLDLAIKNEKKFICDPCELERKGTSYMVETLASLRKKFPKHSLLLLIGMDTFEALPCWFRWQTLFNYAHVVVMTRPPHQPNPLMNFFKTRMTENVSDLKQNIAGRLYFQPVTPLTISSTQIRKLCSQGLSPRFLMPDNVINYLYQHKLYRNLNAS